MTCAYLTVDGHAVIVCGRRVPLCCCGNAGELLCDWKTGTDRTCDAVLCADCSTSPSPGKDLCSFHAESWATHSRNPVRVV